MPYWPPDTPPAEPPQMPAAGSGPAPVPYGGPGFAIAPSMLAPLDMTIIYPAAGIDLLDRPRIVRRHIRRHHRGFLDGVTRYPGKYTVGGIDDGHVKRGEHAGSDREPGTPVWHRRGSRTCGRHLRRLPRRRVRRPVRHGYSSPVRSPR